MKTGVGRREQWTGEVDSLAQGCPWSLPSQRPFAGGPLGATTVGATPGSQAGQEGGFTVLVGVGEGGQDEEGQLLALFPSCWGLELFLALSTRSPWRWEKEEELAGDLGFFL